MEYQTLGTMIASLRKEHDMTQLELAEKMGVTDKAVSKWERDLSCPDIGSLPRMAELLGVSVDELLRVKSQETREDGKEKTDVEALVELILKALALAMGVSVAVLAILRKIDLYSGFTMLGLGLACVGVVMLSSKSGG